MSVFINVESNSEIKSLIGFVVFVSQSTIFKIHEVSWDGVLHKDTTCVGINVLIHIHSPGPKVIKLFSCSNVKLPTIVGILTFISKINLLVF